MKEERVRLILREGDDDSRGQRIASGAAEFIGKWPNQVVSVAWFLVLFLAVLLFLAIIMFVLVQKTYQNQAARETSVLIVNSGSEEPRFARGCHRLDNELCKRMAKKPHPQQSLNVPANRYDFTDSASNIFYIIPNQVKFSTACSIESVLRLCPDKNVFIFYTSRRLPIIKPCRKLDYECFLRDEYSNLQSLSTSGDVMLEGSMFHGLWNATDEAVVTAAKTLVVWQYGGTVLSDNLLMYSRRVFDANDGDCEVDEEFLFCPDPCSAFVFDMMKDIITCATKTGRLNPKELVNKSVLKFCGSEYVIKTGCSGVVRLPSFTMCNSLSKHCLFIRLREWINKNSDWTSKIDKFCPISVRVAGMDIIKNITKM